MSVPGFASPSASVSASAVSVPGSSALLSSALPSASGMSVPMPGSSALLLSALLSASGVSVLVPGLSALLSSALPSASGVSVPVPESSALLSSALPSASGVSVPMPGLSTPSSVSSMLVVFIPVPESSASPSISGVPLPVLGLSPLPFPTWSNPQILTRISGRQKLGQWSGILKRASLEEAPTTFASLFPPNKYPSPLLFPSSSIGEKRPFNKAFNIDCRPLADDHAGEDVG